MRPRVLGLANNVPHEIPEQLGARSFTAFGNLAELVFQIFIDTKGKGDTTHLADLMCYIASA